MNSLKFWLSGLLLVQMALAVGLYWQYMHSSAQPPSEPLLQSAAADIDRLIITGSDGEATLERSAEGWTLPGLADLPADAVKVNTMLDRLANSATGWPVATTASSHQRFEVGKGTFQRHVRLFHAGELAADLLLGTSPGFRRTHLRRAGEDSVYAVELNSFDFPASDGDWLDRQLLSVDDVGFIAGAEYTLEKAGDSWRLAPATPATPATPAAPAAPRDAEAGGVLDQDKAVQIASALAGLRITGVAEEMPEDVEATTLQVRAGDTDYVYHFAGNDQEYMLERSDREQVFTISQYDYEHIAGIGLKDLEAPETAPPQLVEGTSDTGKPGNDAANAEVNDN